MKLIIAGGRHFTDYDFLKQKLDHHFKNEKIDEIVSGRCDTGQLTFITKDKEQIRVFGADGLGELYAEQNNIPVKPFPADWAKYGKKAGYIRNKQMAEYGDGLIAFWDSKSRGTEIMIELATKLYKPVLILKY